MAAPLFSSPSSYGTSSPRPATPSLAACSISAYDTTFFVDHAEFARLGKDFEDRDTVVLGGSTDNEHSKLGWRREHPDLDKLPIWQFADNGGKLARDLGVLDEAEGVALRATFVVDPHNVVQHVYVTNLNVGRAPADTLRVVDALQTDELCPCNRTVGGETLKAA